MKKMNPEQLKQIKFDTLNLDKLITNEEQALKFLMQILDSDLAELRALKYKHQQTIGA
jgi:hypothetical protein